MDQLPPDFRIGPYLDGVALYLNDEIIASASPANRDPDPPWRLSTYPRKPPSYVFLKDEATCRRYLAGWARKWEAEVRERCKYAYRTG